MSSDRPCGNPSCSTSTGIHEGLTFGSGELDFNGYWSRPCHVCAREDDRRRPETRARMARYLADRGKSKRWVRRYIATSEWLWIEAWPFAREEDHET